MRCNFWWLENIYQMRCFVTILLRVVRDSFFTLIRFSLADHLFYDKFMRSYVFNDILEHTNLQIFVFCKYQVSLWNKYNRIPMWWFWRNDFWCNENIRLLFFLRQMRCFLHILLVITNSFFTVIRFSLTDHLFYNNLWLDYQQPLNTKSMILLPLFMGWYSVKRNLYICMENLFNVYKNCLVS